MAMRSLHWTVLVPIVAAVSGIIWITTTIVGFVSAVRGDIVSHRRWMIRSYVVTFGFVSLRVIVMIIAGLGLMSEEAANSPAAWVSWVVPLTMLEIGIRQGRWGLHRLQSSG